MSNIYTSYNGCTWFNPNAGTVVRPKLKRGMIAICEDLKPPTNYYHYSNPASQGALAAETSSFPPGYFPKKELVASAYSDRIQSWDAKRFRDACGIIGGGDQVWCHVASSLSDDQLRHFAQVALNLHTLPKHVRIIHYYNVSNGYSCPVVLAIYDREEAA